MKVAQNNAPIQLDAYFNQTQNKKAQQGGAEQIESKVSRAGKTDTVQLSAQAKKVQQNETVKDTASDIRQDKVSQVKMDIENGTYKVDGYRVATNMLNEAFENNKILNKIDTWA